MNKSELRKIKIAERRELSDNQVVDCSDKICSYIIEMEEYKNSDLILLYASYNNEINVNKMFIDALKKGKTIAFPKSQINENIPEMIFYQITDMKQLREGYKGIMEPDIKNFNLSYVDVNEGLCIVPGVVFDMDCKRIGYGKGFYDRYFASHMNIFKIGVCYDFQIVERIKSGDYDISMDKIITESRQFTGRINNANR